MTYPAPQQARRSPADVSRRRGLFGLAAVLAVAILTTLAYVVIRHLGTATSSAALPFTWSMPQRFGPDRNGDGLVDYDTSAGYLHPSSWPVDLDACGAPALTGRSDPRVTWRISGSSLSTPISRTAGCKIELPVPALGRYRISAALGSTAATGEAQDVTLKDVFIVSVGDSVASGEGDPDIVRTSGVGPFKHSTPVWENQQCHRSALAGPAQAALRLERRDPHSSVTFLHLACSGATIARGLLGPYAGIDPVIDGQRLPTLPTQLDQAISLAGGRKIDTLLVSIGANDMGFGKIVKACLLEEDCSTAGGSQLYTAGIAQLPQAFATLDARLDQLAHAGAISNVLSTQYFDIAGADDGSTCPGPGQGESEDGLSRTEFRWTHDVVSAGLNAAIAKAVAAGNADGGAPWAMVGGIASDFGRHGYCAQDHWVRRISESLLHQHDQFGAFHPNENGQLLGYAKNIEQTLAPLDGFGGRPLPLHPR